MDISLLGPVEVRLDGRPIVLGARKQRALLAMLALQVDRTVSIDRLAEGLWGDEPPPSAAKMVQLYVSRLRRLLDGDAAEIVTHGRGYELRLATGEVDARRFERLLDAARPREALALWRSDPLSDVAEEPFAGAAIRRLEELRVRATELAIDDDLSAGRHAEVLVEIEALLASEPLRERLHGRRMLALYRSGRQGDALEAYRAARASLVTEIGVEPGPELRRLHDAILRQDTSLELPAAERATLPPELDTRTPLDGRERELEWLRAHWRRARGGAGGSVLIVGAAGMGKTRLVAELAAEVLRAGGTVSYVTGDGVPAGAALVVADDVDHGTRAPPPAAESAGALVVTTRSSAGTVPAGDCVTLGPLPADAVRTLARRYVGAEVEIPVDWLLEASGGVPRVLHALAAEWAGGLAVRRVGAAATQIANGRPRLRAAEDELASHVIEAQAVRERAEPGSSRDIVACPFKGLSSFEVEDGEVFFGRERLVADMVARLIGAPVLGIVGASGSGKSSALRAGLLAALASGVLPGSDRWEQAIVRPGEHPLRALERATADGAPRVLAVDQFEELFAACRDPDERAAFVDALMACVGERSLVLIAVRADYYGRCAAYPELARLLGANHVLVGPMRSEDLRRAIELPARRAGLRAEPRLVDALVVEVEGRPGALPLLSTSLLELWRRRDGPVLRLVDHQHTGGVNGAVARLAEQAFERLSEDQRQVARRVLLRLAGEGDGDAVVRRRVGLAELGGSGVDEVLKVLADARLVTVNDATAEVAHEALLREWPRLREWLQQDAEARRLHQHLIRAAQDWQAAGQERAELYRGARLAAALDWRTTHAEELNALERDFLDRSQAEAEVETRRQRRANRRLRALLGGAVSLLALALLAGAVALGQRGQAQDAVLTADAQRLGAEAQSQEDLDHAVLLARTGVDLDDSVTTRGQLLSVLLRDPQALGTFSGDWEPLHYQSLTPDGRVLALASALGRVTFIDTARRRPVGRPYRLRAGYVTDLRFSPDGGTLAVASFDDTDTRLGGVVDLVDAGTHTLRRQIQLLPFPGGARWLGIHVLFLPNGRDVVVQQVHEPIAVAGQPSVLRRFDATTGAPIGGPVRVGRHQTITMWGSGDRRRLFVTSAEDDATYMLDAERLRVLRRWPVGDFAGAVTRDASRFALGSQTGDVRLLDLRSGRLRTFTGRHDARVLRMRFSADARTLVTSGADGVVIVWDVARGEAVRFFTGHARGQVWGLEVTPDGRTAYSAGEDHRALIWDLAGDRSLIRPFALDRPFVPDDNDFHPRGIAISPDGRTLAVGHSDGMVDLLDARTLRRRTAFRALSGFVSALAFSPDGGTLAVTGRSGALALWDTRTTRSLGALHGQTTTSQTLAFSPDGVLLASSDLGETIDLQGRRRDGAVHVWDLRRRAVTALRSARGSANVAFSPDGSLLAIVGASRPTEIRDPISGRLVAELRTPFDSRSVAFSLKGDLIVTGHFDGTVQAWSTSSWQPVGPLLDGHGGKRVLWIGFAHDGATLATAGQDGTIELTDMTTWTPVGVPLNVEPQSFVATALSPNGRHLFALSTSRVALRWDLSPQAWKQHACRVAGRELTPSEWRAALPDMPYRTVCRRG